MTIAMDACTMRARRTLASVMAALLLIGGLAGPACAKETAPSKHEAEKPVSAAVSPDTTEGRVFCNGVRLEDEIEVVNTRSICNCDADALRTGLKFETYSVCDETGNRRWHASDMESYLSFDPAVPTIIFVHGNQITPGDAKCEGLAVYRKIILQGCDAPRIRFVIFSWPASKVGGLLRDVREKAARTGPAGYHLGWLLDQMPAETPISLVGFSFGSRIITGGLHILAGGSLGGSLKLDEPVHPHRPEVNVVLMASATHSYWLAKGEYHGLAMSQVKRALLINNCDDRAMKYYDMLIPGRGGPQALGLCGPTKINKDYAAKIFNRDVSRYVGAEHDLMMYLCAPGDAGLIWDYAGPKAGSESKVGG